MASPNGKRSRDPEEEEMYLDNFHSHKRYLSEIMASSLNGLTVGDTLTESLMESPSRDEVPAPYSPMSEDSDDPHYTYDPPSSSPLHSDIVSGPTSLVSPLRHQKPFCVLSSNMNFSFPLPSVICSHPRQRRSDSEGRFPSSPSDVCHTADLRKAALLRSVQMRTQPNGQSNMQSTEGEEHRTCLCVKNEELHHYEEGFPDDNLHQGEKCFDVGCSSERN